MNTLEQIASSDLCTCCGTCAGMCPNNAIKMQRTLTGLYLPYISEEMCNQCGTCVRVCPGYEVNFQELNQRLFEKQPEDTLLGNYRRCYLGHSKEPTIRYDGASGGIASQLLIFALQNHMIQGALVSRMKKEKPLETTHFIAKTKDEILEAAGSKYCPVSINEGIRQLKKEDGKLAVVGLPCHIHGLRKAESVNKAIKEKIALHIGLMCAHSVNFGGTQFLLDKKGVAKKEIQKISYRGKGWPGSMTIRRRHRCLSVPLLEGQSAYWSIFSCHFFTPIRCVACFDQTNELADLSLGDAWLPELKNERMGKSIIVTRTEEGEKFLKRVESTGAISLQEIPPEKVIESQALNLKFKKADLALRFSLMKHVKKRTPIYKPRPTGNQLPNPAELSRAIFPFVNIYASSNKYARYLLKAVPFQLFRLYYGIYKYLSTI